MPLTQPLTVMTRNLYLGADINRIVVAAMTAQAQGGAPREVLVALANAAHATRAIVERTDFTVRARLLAGEVARTQPDLVGLQEVALWRSGPLQLEEVGVPNATTVDQDFLAVLLDELSGRGMDYAAAPVGIRADVEAPSFLGSPFDGTVSGDPRDVRLTVRDVVLVRARSGITVTGTGDRAFAQNLTVPLLGATIGFDRGYQWVDVRRGSERLRFVNTHLEAFSADLAVEQATELVQVAPAADCATVLVGDVNSDPLDPSVRPLDRVARYAAYELITGAGRFADAWLRWAPAEEGWTSGLSERVDDPTPRFDHRLDMVFTRTPDGAGLAVERGEVTGTRLDDRDPATGLWPSDHGGVVLTLR